MADLTKMLADELRAYKTETDARLAETDARLAALEAFKAAYTDPTAKVAPSDLPANPLTSKKPDNASSAS